MLKKESEDSIVAKKDEEGNGDGASNGGVGDSKMIDSNINGERVMSGAGCINGDAASKLHEAMKVYKTQHKTLIQDCLIAAGFDQREIEDNSRLYSDFEEILKREGV